MFVQNPWGVFSVAGDESVTASLNVQAPVSKTRPPVSWLDRWSTVVDQAQAWALEAGVDQGRPGRARRCPQRHGFCWCRT